MNLKYDSIDRLSFSDSSSIDIGKINNILQRFAENDIKIFGSNDTDTKVPGIWENRWYNDQNNKNLYYKKGESVWINTEGIDDFIIKNEAIIREYAMHNAKTRGILIDLDNKGDISKIKEFYKDVVQGKKYNENNPLFCLGDINKPVQIMISQEDNNTDRPDKEYYLDPSPKWKPFFIYQTEQGIIDKLNELGEEIVKKEFDQHMIDYHLSDIVTQKTFIDNYVKNDFSNISNYQKFRTHNWYSNELNDGFDSVVYFVMKKYESGYKWFRLWSSGFLEHGGIVSIVNHYDTQDSYNNSIYTVKLNWLYDRNNEAKIYDYGSELDSEYYLKNVENIDIGESNDGIKTIIPISNMILGSKQRYSIEITPFNTQDYKPFHTGGGFERYVSKEVCQIDNDRFSFFASSPEKYSYYIAGFTRP